MKTITEYIQKKHITNQNNVPENLSSIEPGMYYKIYYVDTVEKYPTYMSKCISKNNDDIWEITIHVIDNEVFYNNLIAKTCDGQITEIDEKYKSMLDEAEEWLKTKRITYFTRIGNIKNNHFVPDL